MAHDDPHALCGTAKRENLKNLVGLNFSTGVSQDQLTCTPLQQLNTKLLGILDKRDLIWTATLRLFATLLPDWRDIVT
jgi:hypothetical protein